ncbi:MAG: YdcF family protein [Candidatus Levybacteria bacterium]|nr:YdcF family protein [Candidatus Levybacteria bacterium]
MPEGTDANLSEIRPEAKEINSPKLDKLIVFGQGPVKPLLFSDELTPQQQAVWEDFKKDPLHKNEPDFRAVELKGGQDKEVERPKLQKLGRMALKRWGRQNALAAGAALYSGLTSEVILSGGKTRPEWAKNPMPSEAELMKDIIVRIYGHPYLKKYGRDISASIKLEDSSTNTLENLANTINGDPDILEKDQKVGLLSADFHLRRVAVLSHLFSVEEAPGGQLSAQNLLRERVEQRKSGKYQEILQYMTDTMQNDDLRQRIMAEQRWERGLIEPENLSYWLGYLADVENSKVLSAIVTNLKNPSWVASARETFLKVGLNFDDFSEEDVSTLGSNDPAKFESLISGLRKLKTPEFRKMDVK